MCSYQHFGKTQAKPSSLVVAGFVYGREGLEDAGQVLGVDPYTGIRHADLKITCFAHLSDCNCNVASFCCELGRIVEEVHDHLVQPSRIGLNGKEAVGNLKMKLLRFLVENGLNLVNTFPKQIPKIDILQLKLEFSGLHALNVQ